MIKRYIIFLLLCGYIGWLTGICGHPYPSWQYFVLCGSFDLLAYRVCFKDVI